VKPRDDGVRGDMAVRLDRLATRGHSQLAVDEFGEMTFLGFLN
jgi:hypothetical protein